MIGMLLAVAVCSWWLQATDDDMLRMMAHSRQKYDPDGG
jgi:hypothetical protein